jgi:hypothetical protein
MLGVETSPERSHYMARHHLACPAPPTRVFSLEDRDGRIRREAKRAPTGRNRDRSILVRGVYEHREEILEYHDIAVFRTGA